MGVNELVTAIATNGIGLVCAAAVLWFAYYRETKTIPLMMGTFNQSLKQFSDSVGVMQDAFTERNRDTLKTFSDQMTAERTTCQKWHEENRQAWMQVMTETKENRHLIRNLGNQLGLRSAVEAERAKREDQ
jgi:gas vesicle protein